MGVSVVAGACLADRRSAKAKVARPGIRPTGRRVILPNVVVMGAEQARRLLDQSAWRRRTKPLSAFPEHDIDRADCLLRGAAKVAFHR